MDTQSNTAVTPYNMSQPLISRRVLLGILVVVVLYMAYFYGLFDSLLGMAPTDTPQGGVAPSSSPVVNPATPGTQISSNTTPPVNTPMVKVIEVTKDSTGKPLIKPDDYTFQIGEIKAYSDKKLLTAEDYESAKYTKSGDKGLSLKYPATNAIDGSLKTFSHTNGKDPIHQLTLTLKEPQFIHKVEVLNRSDCCQERLAGVIVKLKDESGIVLKQSVLTADRTQIIELV